MTTYFFGGIDTVGNINATFELKNYDGAVALFRNAKKLSDYFQPVFFNYVKWFGREERTIGNGGIVCYYTYIFQKFLKKVILDHFK